MDIKVKKIVELNNERRKLLTPENKEFYENFVVYIRANSFMRDEKATEEVLLEMLDHLLEAQKEGKSAEEVFGKTPKQLADEISRTLPKESIKNVIEFSFEILLIFFGWFLLPIGIFTYFMEKTVEVHIVSLIIYTILLITLFSLFVVIVMRVMRKSAFVDEKMKKRQIWFFSLITGVVIVSVGLAFKIIGSFGPKIEIDYYTILGLGCFFLLASYL